MPIRPKLKKISLKDYNNYIGSSKLKDKEKVTIKSIMKVDNFKEFRKLIIFAVLGFTFTAVIVKQLFIRYYLKGDLINPEQELENADNTNSQVEANIIFNSVNKNL